MSNVTAAIQSIDRTIGSADATINFQPSPVFQVFVGSTIKINNRLNGGYIATATVTDVVSSTAVIVTGISAVTVSDFTIPDDEHSSEDRYSAIGMDALGRVLVVVFTWRGNRIRLISARKATRHEQVAYRGEL